MRFRILGIALGLLALASPGGAQTREPKTFADCDALYERELKRFAAETNRDLRLSQSKASIQRIRCERAIERKLIQARAKAKR